MKIDILADNGMWKVQILANIGNGKVLNCGKKFVIYQTAAVETFHGQLVIGNLTLALECLKVAEQKLKWNIGFHKRHFISQL